MERFYYIDNSGYIDYVGKFDSNEDADEFMELNQINSFWLFSETYLEDFIRFASKTIAYYKESDDVR